MLYFSETTTTTNGCVWKQQSSRVWVVAVLVLARPTLAFASSSNTNKFVTFPLIPHHVQKARRLAELGIINIEQDEQDDDDEEEAWRARYPRRNSRHLKSNDNSTTSITNMGALYHGYGTHYMDLWCGSPVAQRQTVIVDTGSGVTAFPCKDCNNCGAPKYHIDEYFDESRSETFQKTPCMSCTRGASCSKEEPDFGCAMSMSYAEGSSWYAYEATDHCYVGGFHSEGLDTTAVAAAVLPEDEQHVIDPAMANQFAFPLQFGCQTKLTGLFKTQLADGIMGMKNTPTSFWQQMYFHSKLSRQIFGLCYSRPKGHSREGTEAGAMTLGGIDERLNPDSPMIWTQSNPRETGFFHVHVRSIHLRHGDGGESALTSTQNARVVTLDVEENDINRGGTIIDSGTTDTYWNKQISQAFRAAYEDLSGHAYTNKGTKFSIDDLSQLPTILFQIVGEEAMNAPLLTKEGGVVGLAGDLDPDHPWDLIIALPPSHYMEYSHGKYTSRFYDTENAGNVMGANTMMGHSVVFDAENHRVGWAESSCNYTQVVQDAGYDLTTSSSTTTTTTSTTESSSSTSTSNNKDDDSTTPSSPSSTSLEEQKKTNNDNNNVNSNNHDGSSPVDDLKKVMETCESLTCRGGFLGVLLALLLLGYAFGRCCCPSTSRRYEGYGKVNNNPELELSNHHGDDDDDDDDNVAGFRDEIVKEDNDDNDPEYGEFPTKS